MVLFCWVLNEGLEHARQTLYDQAISPVIKNYLLSIYMCTALGSWRKYRRCLCILRAFQVERPVSQRPKLGADLTCSRTSKEPQVTEAKQDIKMGNEVLQENVRICFYSQGNENKRFLFHWWNYNLSNLTENNNEKF